MVLWPQNNLWTTYTIHICEYISVWYFWGYKCGQQCSNVLMKFRVGFSSKNYRITHRLSYGDEAREIELCHKKTFSFQKWDTRIRRHILIDAHVCHIAVVDWYWSLVVMSSSVPLLFCLFILMYLCREKYGQSN